MIEYTAEVDPRLIEELKHKKFVRIIVEFFMVPKQEQIAEIENLGMNIDCVFKNYPMVSGAVDIERMEKISKLSYVKKIWLDQKIITLKSASNNTYNKLKSIIQ